MALENDYEVLERLGEGSFGKVYKAAHRKSGDIVAVKQIKLGAKSWDEALKATELQALRTLRHTSIVRLRELLRSQHDGSLYYVFEFVGSDLFRLMRQHPQGLEEGRAAALTRQLLEGLAHIHMSGFFHRDIKPENVLFDEASQTVRIADFGEARSVRARPPFTDYVGTRWYRAPECLLRDRSYSSPVDVWASGLVFAELLRGSPVFMGTSSIDQLYKILQVIGQPSREDWPEFSRLAEAMRFRLPDGRGCGLVRVVPLASPPAQALLTEILNPNPRRRPLARKCLENAFFSRLPPLDLERAEAQRDRVNSVTSTARDAPEERESTHRSSAAPSAVDETVPGLGHWPPPAPPASSAGPASSRSMAQQGGSSQPRTPQSDEQCSDHRKFTMDLVDDVDLDAELDKILSPASPSAPSGEADPAIGLAGIPGGARPASAWDAHMGEVSLNNANFSFAPYARSSRPSSGASSARGCEAVDAKVVPVVDPSADHARLPRPPIDPSARHRPSSPCGGSVEALLDSLCADLGVAKDPLLGAVAEESPLSGFGDPALVMATGRAGSALEVESMSDVGDLGAEKGGVSRSDSRASQHAHAGAQLPPMYRGAADLPSSRGPSPDPSPENYDCQPVGLRPDTGLSGLSTHEPLPSNDEDEASGSNQADVSREPQTWTEDEAQQLRRIVKKVTRRGTWEKEALWEEVAKELGGGRIPRECKIRYTRDYKARKAGQDPRPRAPSRGGGSPDVATDGSRDSRRGLRDSGRGQGPETEVEPLPISAA